MEKLKTYTLDQITDKHIGKRGTTNREIFENELQLELLEKQLEKPEKKET